MTGFSFFSSLPLGAMVLLVASRRTTILLGGVVGLAISACETYFGLLPNVMHVSAIWTEALKGAWIGIQSSLVVAAGFFFQSVTPAGQSLSRGQDEFSHRRLWAVCFLAGPVAESATGVGVGAMIALPVIQAMGLSGASAVVLSLYSQILVPWGALSIGTIVGATLSHVPPGTLALATAILTAPLLFGYLGLYWLFVKRAGHPTSVRQKLDDVAWTCFLAGAIICTSAVVAVELGVLVAGSLLLLLRYWRDERPGPADLLRAFHSLAPYVVLIFLMVGTRSIPSVRDVLLGGPSFRPFPELPAYDLFYHPTFFLFVVAILSSVASGTSHRLVPSALQTASRTWRPIAVMVVFLSMAQLLASAGAATAVGSALQDTLGRGAQVLAPLLGGLGGFLVGSNAASTGLLMPLQISLGLQDSLWSAAVQNTSASNFTLLSPARVGLVVALARLPGGERRLYQEAWLIGIMLATVLTTEAAVIAFAG